MRRKRVFLAFACLWVGGFYVGPGRLASLLLAAAFGSLSEETGVVETPRLLMFTLTRLAVGLGASSLPGVCKQRRKPRSRRLLRPVGNGWVPR